MAIWVVKKQTFSWLIRGAVIRAAIRTLAMPLFWIAACGDCLSQAVRRGSLPRNIHANADWRSDERQNDSHLPCRWCADWRANRRDHQLVRQADSRSAVTTCSTRK